MRAKPVQISFDEALLSQIDTDPEVRENGRSAFVRRAVKYYLSAKARREIETGILSAYEGEADAMANEIAELIGSSTFHARTSDVRFSS